MRLFVNYLKIFERKKFLNLLQSYYTVLLSHTFKKTLTFNDFLLYEV